MASAKQENFPRPQKSRMTKSEWDGFMALWGDKENLKDDADKREATRQYVRNIEALNDTGDDYHGPTTCVVCGDPLKYATDENGVPISKDRRPFCAKCNTALYKGYRPLGNGVKQGAKPKECPVCGCTLIPYAHGICKNCMARAYRFGRVFLEQNKTDDELIAALCAMRHVK